MEGNIQSRNAAIDISRGIAALLMIISHLGLHNEVEAFIFSFHMPLFFFISGMTMHEEKKLGQYLKKRIRRIFIPYVIFALIYSNPEIIDWIYCLSGTRAGLKIAGSLHPLWFLPCLFSADVIFHLVLKYCRKEKVMCLVSIVLAFFGIAIRFFLPFGITLPFGFDVAMVSIPFVLIGYSLWLKTTLIHRVKENPGICILAIIGMLTVLLFTYSRNLPPSATNGVHHVEMATGSYGNVFLFYFNSIIGSLSVILFSELMSERLNLIKNFGNCTMACLVSHWGILSVMEKIGNSLGINGVAYQFVTVIVIVIAAFGVNRVLEEYAPNLIGKSG